MRKRVLLALVLVAALLLSTGCSLIVKDEEVDKQTVVIEVAGKSYTKGELQQHTEDMLDYYEYVYTNYYGMDFDPTLAESRQMAQEDAISSLIETAVLEKKIAEAGLDQLTAEETAEMEAAVSEEYNTYVEFIQNFVLTDTELTGDELQAAIDEQMVLMGYGTREEMLENQRTAMLQEKLMQTVVAEVELTEEEIQSEYDFRMTNARTTYEEYPESYGADLTNGITGMYYAPEGYRYVKHILVSFTEEDQAAIDELNSQLYAKQDELFESDDAAVQAEIDALEAEIASATEKAVASIMPTIEEIQGKLAAGESFDTLIDEYNQDPGMTSDSVGYAVSAQSTNWVPEFTEASMTLAAIGDVSAPVPSSYGVHLIQYASDIPAGEIGLENVREELAQELLEEKQNNHFADQLNQWIEEAGAKVYENRL